MSSVHGSTVGQSGECLRGAGGRLVLNSPSLTAQDIGRTTRGGDAGDHADDHATNGPHLHRGIEKDGAFATFVTVSGSAELFGTIRPVKVSGTIDGHPFSPSSCRRATARTASPPRWVYPSSSAKTRPATK